MKKSYTNCNLKVQDLLERKLAQVGCFLMVTKYDMRIYWIFLNSLSINFLLSL